MARIYKRKWLIESDVLPRKIGSPLRCSFDLEGQLNGSAIFATIRVYNLASDTRAALFTEILNPGDKPKNIVFTAGHEERFGVLLNGQITWCKSVYQESNWITIIQVSQTANYFTTKGVFENLKGQPKYQRLQMLISAMADAGCVIDAGTIDRIQAGGSIAALYNSETESKPWRKNTHNVYQTLQLELEQIGAGSTIDQRGLVISKVGEKGSSTVININQKTGLIGTPEFGTPSGEFQGVRIRMQLDPTLQIGTQLNVSSKTITKEVYPYAIQAIGDTHGEDWLNICDCATDVIT